MKTCIKCGNSFEGQFKFCPECGTATESSSASAVDVSMGDARTMAGGGNRKAEGVDRGAAGRADLSVGDARTMAGGWRSDVGDQRSEAGNREADESVDARYEILEEIGRGGFARVWKARDRKLGRIVALKRLNSAALSGPEGARTLERFRREAQAIASLNHRNIVGVYDRGEDTYGPYIVMEYVDGGSLRDVLKARGRLDVPEAMRIADAVAKGLDHAHRRNLIHRDIKPANILMHREGSELVPKIADFGLARAGSETDVSMSGYGMGTPAYMPPEQRRDAKNVNHTADLYALGKTLYEMVTGLPPDDVDADKLPPSLARIVKRCVKTNSDERYFSAAELLADLEHAAAEAPSVGEATKGSKVDNVCPACGKKNDNGIRYCVGCGAGLIRICPECGGDVAVHSPFCGGCGTDIAVFERIRDGVARMEKFAIEKQWGRVLKEHELLPANARMPGVKGRAWVVRAETLKVSAQSAVERGTTLRRAVEQAVQEGRWKDARKAAQSCLEVEPQNAEMASRLSEFQEKTDDEVWKNALDAVGRNERAGRLADALATVCAYQRDYPDGRHGADCQAARTRLEKLVTLGLQRVGFLTQDDLKGADAKLAEMTEAGLSKEGAEVLLADAQALRDTLERQNLARRQRAKRFVSLGVALIAALAVASGLFALGLSLYVARLVSEAERAKAQGNWKTVLSLTQWIGVCRFNYPGAQVLYKEACEALAPCGEKDWVSPATGMAFVWVPALNMWVGKYEVTNGEYRKMKRWHNSKEVRELTLNGDRQPVVQVNFGDAKFYANWATEKDGDRLCGGVYRLPSESEWQAVASCGGTQKYPWGSSMPPSFGNYADATAARTLGFAGFHDYDDNFAATCAVELSGANRWGLFGFGGNVWECCASDNTGSTFGAWHGASWANFMNNELACDYRRGDGGEVRNASSGFRLVLSRR